MTSSGDCDISQEAIRFYQFPINRQQHIHSSTRLNFSQFSIQSIPFNFSNSHNSKTKPTCIPFSLPDFITLLLQIVPSILFTTLLPSLPLQLVDSRGFSSINYAVGRRRRRNIHYGSRAAFRNARVARFMDRPRASRLSAGQDYRRQPSWTERRVTRIRGFYWYELHARNDMCIREFQDEFHQIPRRSCK